MKPSAFFVSCAAAATFLLALRPAAAQAAFATGESTPGLEVRFLREGVHVRVRESSFASLHYGLVAWGWAGRTERVAPVAPVREGAQRQYRRGKVVEWYRPGGPGLEQGFTVSSPPAGSDPGETLEFQVAFRGRLRVEVDASGRWATLVEDDGTPRLRYAGLSAWDARGETLTARMVARGERRLGILVQAENAAYPLTIDPFLILEQQIVSSGSTGAQFGRSVSIDGDTLLVGAPLDDNSGIGDDGSAFVYVKDASGWSQSTKLVASDKSSGAGLGSSVSLEGTTAVVGAPQALDTSGTKTGAAYVFVDVNGAWQQQFKLLSFDGAQGDRFGDAVSLSGDTVAVGAPFDDNGAGTDAGSVHIFVRVGALWIQQAKLTASDAAAGAQFGTSVALEGERLVVGAPGATAAGNVSAGAVYVFQRSGITWTQTARIEASDPAAVSLLGYSVAVSGDTICAGSPNADVGGLTGAGAAYVFVLGPQGWEQQAKLAAPDAGASDGFGRAVSLDGDALVVGSPFHDVGGNTNQGAVYLSRRFGVDWSPLEELTGFSASSGLLYGSSVAWTGNRLVVGAPSASPGRAYVYRFSDCSAIPYGEGCSGVCGVPVLSDLGCPAPGQGISVVLQNAPAPGTAIFLLGSGAGQTPVCPSGCTVDVLPVFPVSFSLPLFPCAPPCSCPIVIPWTVPPQIATPADVFLQVVVPTPGSGGCGFAISNALRLHINP